MPISEDFEFDLDFRAEKTKALELLLLTKKWDKSLETLIGGL